MAVFTGLLTILVFQLCKGRTQLGALSVFIAVLSLLNSVFATVRISAVYPFETSDSVVFRIVFALENVCFFGATWLFGIKYFEVAQDIEFLVFRAGEETYESIIKKMERKKCFNYVSWSVFCFICMCTFLPSVAYKFIQDWTLYSVINTVSFCLLSLVVVGTSLAMTIAFFKFIRIVQRTQTSSDFNRCYIVVQIIGLLFWLAAWVIGGIFLFLYDSDFHDFYLSRNLLLLDLVGFMATMLNFLIIAYVIYKTALVAALSKKNRNDLNSSGGETSRTVLSFLQVQYSAIQRKASMDTGSHRATHSPMSLSPPYLNARREPHQVGMGGETEFTGGTSTEEALSHFSERPVSRNQLGVAGVYNHRGQKENFSVPESDSNSYRQHESSAYYQQQMGHSQHRQISQPNDFIVGHDDWYLCEGLL